MKSQPNFILFEMRTAPTPQRQLVAFCFANDRHLAVMSAQTRYAEDVSVELVMIVGKDGYRQIWPTSSVSQNCKMPEPVMARLNRK